MPEIAKASVAAAEANLRQRQSALDVAETNLRSTVLKSPMKGVVIARRVNLGQNVFATSTNPWNPSLFLIAKDLKKMQVWAQVNETDFDQIRKGMKATFTVDAFPKETFKGTVSQIRLRVATAQNTAVYEVVADVDNPDLKLMPYMRANLRFQIDPRRNVLRVPNAALRWQPSAYESMLPSEEHGLRAGGVVWVKADDGQHVRRIEVDAGASDAQWTEVSGPNVKEGMEIVIGKSPDAKPSR